MNEEALGALLAEEVARGVFPGGALGVYRCGFGTKVACFGHIGAADGPEVTTATRYDLASVTKPIIGSLVLQEAQRGRLDLRAPVGRYLPSFSSGERRACTVRDLMVHTAGLPSVPNLCMTVSSSKELRQVFDQLPLVHPPGTRVLYTSLGYQYLGQILAVLCGKSLDELVSERVAGPYGLRQLGYGCGPGDEVAPTEYSDFRRRLIKGEVHDENAYFLGGLDGHTGVFSTITDLIKLATLWLDVLDEQAFEVVTPAAELRRTPLFTVDDPQFAVWHSTLFGHTGFTGTSMALVPKRGSAVALLTNRVYPHRKEGMDEARRRIHQGVLELLDNE